MLEQEASMSGNTILADHIDKLTAEIAGLRTRNEQLEADCAAMREIIDRNCGEIGLSDAGKALLEERDELRRVLEAVRPVVQSTPMGHTRNCTYDIRGDSPETDYCTCDLEGREHAIKTALATIDAALKP
jgi:hypothetical protein